VAAGRKRSENAAGKKGPHLLFGSLEREALDFIVRWKTSTYRAQKENFGGFEGGKKD